MTEEEKRTIDVMVKIVQTLSLPDRETFLAFGEGMAFKAEQQRSERVS